MDKKADNKTMKLHGDYFTIQEIADILGESTNTIKKRILRLGIKATAKYAIYTSGDLENIKNVKMGRPPKKADKPAPGKKPPAKQKKAP